MTPRDFCYWLRGKLDDTGPAITAGDLEEIDTRLSECIAMVENPLRTIPAGTKPVQPAWVGMNKPGNKAGNQWSNARFGKMKGLSEG